MYQRRSMALVVLSAISVSSFANSDSSERLVVTATRTAQTADKSLAAVSVLTRADIERSQAKSLPEILSSVPGLDLSTNGGTGKVANVFLRGTNSDHVLVLIDGVKVGSATLGTTAFQDIPVEQIDRIEVVRGPRSSLYGSEAIGGVIQIFTRRGGGETTPHFAFGVGDRNTFEGSAGVSGGGKQNWYSVNLAGNSTSGINACSGPLDAGCFTDEPDADGYRNNSIALRAGSRFNNGAEVEAQWLRARAKNFFDGSFVNEAIDVQQMGSVRAGFAPTAIWHTSVTLGRSWDESDNYLSGEFSSQFDSRRDTVGWQNELSIGDAGLATLGVDYQNDKVDSDTAYDLTQRDNKGIYGQYQTQIAGNDWLLSARRDDNEQFGKHNTANLGWGYDLTKRLRLTASYGTAFKAPSFNELYYPGFGNAALSPETSRSIEFGLAGKLADVAWQLNAYQTKVEDLIAFDATTFAPNNIDSARIRGVEADAKTQWQQYLFHLNANWVDPENQSADANNGHVLPRRARDWLRADADRQYGVWGWGATYSVYSSRYEDLANQHELGGYNTVDLRASYGFQKSWRAEAKLANAFDKHYKTAAYYNQPGRSVFVGVRYEPGAKDGAR